MKILDTSHWQGDRKLIDWDKVKADGYEVVYMKCTQGVDFLDSMFKRDKAAARAAGLLCGFYHFAGNTNKIAQYPEREADWFLKNVGDLQLGEFIVLDWEINYSNPPEWCKAWLDYVSERVGFKPLIYMSESRVLANNWIEVVKGNYGLIVAKYGINNGAMGTAPKSGQWPFVAIHQYTSRGKVNGIVGNVDLDYSSMDLETLKKYGKQENAVFESTTSNVEPVISGDISDKFLNWPIDKVYITQKFGENPAMYRKYGMFGHNGIDLRTRFIDSPLGHRYVTAPQDGVVVEVGNQGRAGYGRFVRIECRKHKDGNEQHIFGHLSKSYVKVGRIVLQGDLLALTDNTGASTGSHLHYGYRQQGWKLDYQNGFKGYSDPLPFLESLS